MGIKAILPPEDRRQHDINVAEASRATLKLARVLQITAFSQSHQIHRFDEFKGAFDPAPVYLAQATVISKNADLRNKLLAALMPFNPKD